ncbi:LytR C-terminal domain-containing protein [Nocardioides taihuensis]|uniref:LytR C-terminal domain-containing protein n=1 Tax=Nocardioides taihuensis TaxID=1835606 RepID=A0ABW0BEV9_9ACTN
MARRFRGERGVAFPSPVVMLSVVAVAMAGLAYVATQGGEPTEREVTTVSLPDPGSPTTTTVEATPEPAPVVKKDKPPPVQRGKVYVEVYNNSGITGLAGEVAARADRAGWQVVGADNWYGSIPASTVYFPQRLERAGKLLAADLDIDRTRPAIEGPMKLDRLTVVLTADAQ